MTVVQHQTQVKEISFSAAALKHLATFLSQQKGSIGVRLSVKKTGCSGLSYVVAYVEEAALDDLVQPLLAGYQLYVDKNSYPYLQGLQIDYVREGLNYKFVFHNPNQTGHCGCGESFTVN